MQPKGEIMFFKKPSETLTVLVKTDKNVYAPGDTVSYSVSVMDKTTNKLVTDRQVMVSIVVTDDSVFNKVENRKQPPSLASAVYLENEVIRNNWEFYNANQYIEHLFSSGI